MSKLENWYGEFEELVPLNEKELTSSEATFRCLQGIAFTIDKIVNVEYRDLLGGCAEKANKQTSETCWCNLDELCRRHPELRRSNVISRKWRLENGFPSKGEYKCRQMFYEPDVVDWINRHLRV